MKQRRPYSAVVLAAALAAVAIGAAWLARIDQAPRSLASRPEPSTEVARAEPSLEPTEIAVDEPRAPRIAALDTRTEVDLVRAHVWLRGKLDGARGLGRELELSVEAELAADERDGQRTDPLRLDLSAAADGTLIVDVTPLFEDPERLPRALTLGVRHAAFGELAYSVAARCGGERVDAAMLAREDDLVIEFAARLEPRCRVRGQAWARDRDVARIRIEAWQVRGDRLTGSHASDVVGSADDVYELSLEPEQRYALVATADGCVPVTISLFTFGTLDLWSAPLVLDSGVAIEGHVDLKGYLFGGSARLSLEPQVLGLRQAVGPDGMVWNGVTFQPAEYLGATDAAGSFTLAGLVPGRYSLRMGIERSRWTEMDPIYDVYAPSSGLELAPPFALVTWELEYRGEPLYDHAIRVNGLAHGVRVDLRTDAGGRASAWLLQGEPYQLEVPMYSQTTGRTNDWTYGKIVPWQRAAWIEHIAMGPSD